MRDYDRDYIFVFTTNPNLKEEVLESKRRNRSYYQKRDNRRRNGKRR